MSKYHFRAELLGDFYNFLNGSIKKIGFKNFVVSCEGPEPDIEVDLEAGMSLEDIRNELRKVEDGHVMVQTITLKDDYTGKRDYLL